MEKFTSVFLTIYFSVLFSGFFFLDKGLHRGIMYAGIPLILYYLYKNRDQITSSPVRWPLFIAVATYTLINTLSATWSTPFTLDGIIQESKLVILYPLIFLPFIIAHKSNAAFWSTCLTFFVTVSIITAIGLFVTQWDGVLNHGRLNGWGRVVNPVTCGFIYGLAFLIALFGKKQLFYFRNIPWFIFYPLAVIPLLALILTQSRGPFLATAALIVIVPLVQVYFSKGFKRSIILPFIIFAIACGAFLYCGNSMTFDRGTTGRTQIWKHAVELVQEKPVLGHGIATEFVYPFILNGKAASAEDPHNLYLSALVHTGFAGLILQVSALLAGLYFSALKFRDDGDASPMILLGFGAIMGLVDFGGFYKNLDITWLVFWFPIALLLLRPATREESKA